MKLSKSAKNYLEDIFGSPDINKLDPITMNCILENIESSMTPGESSQDLEIKQIYFKLHKLPEMTSAQFRERYSICLS